MKRPLRWLSASVAALGLCLTGVTTAHASAVDVAVVDTTVPLASVNLEPGTNGPIVIKSTITGNQQGTATFKVYTSWTLSGGVFTGSNPVTHTVAPRAANDPATVFDDLGTVSVAAGQATGTFTLSATAFDITNTNATGAKLNAGNSASYSVTVIRSVNTAPVVTVTGVTSGASYEYNAVPTATCSVTDAEDGPSSFAATLSEITGPLAAFGLGSQTASCSYTDAGGLTATSSVTYSIVDTTDPVITYSGQSPAANGAGWNNSDVTVTWTCTDAKSGVTSSTDSATTTGEGDNLSVTGTCVDGAGNTASATVSGIKVDKTAPTITGATVPMAPDGSNGWYVTPVTVNWTCTDTLSGVASVSPSASLTDGADQSVMGTCTDKAGNTASATVSDIDVDTTAPTIEWNGGPQDGATYYFGSVPAAGTCTAVDALSGPGTCAVTGYGTTVGTHTLTATAYDVAGNKTTETRTYTVLAWTLNGFFQPVDMNSVWNTVKNGSTVPLKFEVFAGATELTDVSAVDSFTVKSVACPGSSATSDDIELTTTGGTQLRYDLTGGQFIQNWQTPKRPGTCWTVTMTTDDGSFLSANFKLK
jgi:hypothetical protein